MSDLTLTSVLVSDFSVIFQASQACFMRCQSRYCGLKCRLLRDAGCVCFFSSSLAVIASTSVQFLGNVFNGICALGQFD